MDDVAGFPLQPSSQGLYDPDYEKDACGIGLIASIRGSRSHSIVQDAISLLNHLRHRGAQGADPETGDGCGILTQIPDRLFRELPLQNDPQLSLPPIGEYAAGMIFLPGGKEKPFQELIRANFEKEGFRWIAWRRVPTVSSAIGALARKTEPSIWNFFVAVTGSPEAFERRLYAVRRTIENRVLKSDLLGREHFSIPSLSTKTIVYKGLLLPEQLGPFYPDLGDERFESAIAMVHSRFSTNTFPTWPLAHPYRYLSHNGEINTLKGNLNWMRAREGALGDRIFGHPKEDVLPIIPASQSDSACLDNMLEFLVLGGRSLPHAMMMLIPEPWVANASMDLERRGFYEYHAAMMEPWDGPAAVCFTDGRWVGATLDRNGLRPCRYLITRDDRVILSSEAGVLPIAAENIVKKGRLEPGKMFLVDTEAGRVVEDEEIKALMASQKPYRSWVTEHRLSLDEFPELRHLSQADNKTLKTRQKLFGYTEEELKWVLLPMAVNGEEALSSMGTDTPLAVLSLRPQLLFNYFKQLFAQVTNPPIDPIREQLVMSLTTYIGPKSNVLIESPDNCRRIRIHQPILTNSDLEKIRAIPDETFKSATLSAVFELRGDSESSLSAALDQLCQAAERSVDQGVKYLIISDRKVDEKFAPIPSLLAVSAIHQHLIAQGKRTLAGLLVETGEARDVHHFAMLIGFGAGAVNPYLAFETLHDMAEEGRFPEAVDAATAEDKFVKAISKGLLKIFSKMGISTVQSYCGAQIFEAIGLHRDLVDRYFKGTPSRIGGMGLREIAWEAVKKHQLAYAENDLTEKDRLDLGGEIHFRVQGEHHGWNPETIASLQIAAREGSAKSYREFSDLANGKDRVPSMLRDLLELAPKKSISITEVEPASEILKRFTTGAMSLGAISKEAHETLAIAMNRVGGKSNTGEGGEDAERFKVRENGDSANSAIKQIASARFGVTTHYLVNAVEIQIKMAQGAKPGEGGQLPGHKVDETIARLRHATPGVQLISPPPHHDIYSIEDLAQLIFDLKNVNALADISVKLVSEVGVGTVAAGVAKAGANKILISGDSGGTGASPLSSIKYAGAPWEIGLAETHQTLLLNGLRDQVKIETDGQLRTGRDVVMAALLGAEEFGFATAPLIVEGCVMMRKCHLNTCPVGIATQDPVFRERFTGKPEHVINYLFFVAEEVRELMAELGLREFEELIGQTQYLKTKALPDHPKASRVDLTHLLHQPKKPEIQAQKKAHPTSGDILDRVILKALDSRHEVRLELPVSNTDRTTGAYLSGQIVKEHGADGLAPGSIQVRFAGSAGQSFGAFLCNGVQFSLEGEANDYVAKGLSGGVIAIFPPKNAGFSSQASILIGNTALYGATSGTLLIAGVAGERFAVRNSGATAVVEGVGDHGCEYMTGGRVVVLGKTGRNFAAGMSGGVAFVFDEDGKFSTRCNRSLVELEDLSEPELLQLFELVCLHSKHTGSLRAESLLKDWDLFKNRFVKVISGDYKRALQKKNRMKA